MSFVLCEKVEVGTAGTQKESEAARDTHPVQRGSRWAGLVGF